MYIDKQHSGSSSEQSNTMPSTYRAMLSPFCPSNLASWFAILEDQLYLDNNSDKRRKYFMVLFAYPESTVQYSGPHCQTKGEDFQMPATRNKSPNCC
jgi:hypothetical protein